MLKNRILSGTFYDLTIILLMAVAFFYSSFSFIALFYTYFIFSSIFGSLLDNSGKTT